MLIILFARLCLTFYTQLQPHGFIMPDHYINLPAWLTYIFEVGNDFNLESFDSFISEASETLSETIWELSNFVVSLDDNSAHISYFNNGAFKTNQNEMIRYHWMESAYMVLDDEELKLKFLQSDVVSEIT